jgi:hypothetical protein
LKKIEIFFFADFKVACFGLDLFIGRKWGEICKMHNFFQVFFGNNVVFWIEKFFVKNIMQGSIPLGYNKFVMVGVSEITSSSMKIQRSRNKNA